MKWFTYSDTNYSSIGELTIPIMRKYCKLHNIDFELHNKITSSHSDVYWNKISIIEKELTKTDWIVWCDADILIKNLDFDLVDCITRYGNDRNLLVSSDYRGLCLGFFILRSCDWSSNLFLLLQTLGNIKQEKVGIYDLKNQREQDTLKVLVDFFENISKRTILLPENVISNPRSKERTGAFAHHFWGNNKIGKVAEEIKATLDSNIK